MDETHPVYVLGGSTWTTGTFLIGEGVQSLLVLQLKAWTGEATPAGDMHIHGGKPQTVAIVIPPEHIERILTELGEIHATHPEVFPCA